MSYLGANSYHGPLNNTPDQASIQVYPSLDPNASAAYYNMTTGNNYNIYDNTESFDSAAQYQFPFLAWSPRLNSTFAPSPFAAPICYGTITPALSSSFMAPQQKPYTVHRQLVPSPVVKAYEAPVTTIHAINPTNVLFQTNSSPASKISNGLECCGHIFAHDGDYRRHRRKHDEAPRFRCIRIDCDKLFHRHDKAVDHVKQGHKGESVRTRLC